MMQRASRPNRSRDLEQLLGGGTETSDPLRRVEVETQPREQFTRPLDPGVATKSGPSRPEASEEQILRDRKIVDQSTVLMNNGDASTLGVDGRTQADGPPLEEDLAVIGRIDAGHDLHQRRFPRAVLPQEGVNPTQKEGDGTLRAATTPGKLLVISRNSTNGAALVISPSLQRQSYFLM